MIKPQFKHDCEDCTLLAVIPGYDLYHCESDVMGPTVVARHGDIDSENMSGIVFDFYPLNIAKAIAREQGLPMTREAVMSRNEQE